MPSRRSRDLNMRDPQGGVAATSVDLEQGPGSFGAATAQLGEHELGAEPGVPDEPVSLGPVTSASAQITRQAGNGSIGLASHQTQGIAAWRRSRRAWRAASVSDGP